MSLVSVLSVAAGGAIGAASRYLVSVTMSAEGRFPWATFTVNLVGCFVAGCLISGLLARFQISPPVQLFLTTGLLGGFTTFSAFSVDTLRLAESGHWTLAVINALANLFGCLLAVGAGWWIARLVIT